MQTIYAVLALGLAGLLALSLKQGDHADAADRSQVEIEAVALATAEDGLDWATTLPFDSDTETGLSGLTPASLFGNADGSFAAANDLDDLDGATRTSDVALADGTIPLTAAASVRYVMVSASGLTSSAVPTLTKELTLRVTGPLGAEVTISRLYPFRSGL